MEIPAKVGYRPGRIIEMLRKNGGDAHRTVLELMGRYSDHGSDGIYRLHMAGCLHLSFEALMLEYRFRPLFTDEQIRWAENLFRNPLKTEGSFNRTNGQGRSA
ncbi:MAG: hypothetical protein HYY13_01455 [Nitrospirae bacterium]|nr:hypothetical protein [Nitrospirota bacterium]